MADALRRAAPDGGGTVGKALDVLEEVAAFGRPVRFAELQARSALPKATLYRLVQTLAGQGMLILDPETGRYAMGRRLVRLAHVAWSQASLAPVARPHVERLAHETGRTVHLAELEGGHVLYLDKHAPEAAPDTYSAAGRIGPAYCTGVGKAMLAHLPEDALAEALAEQSFKRHTPATLTDEAALRADLAAIRRRGHAFDAEEHEPGVVCVAMPVLSGGGHVLGALSVTGHGTRAGLGGMARAALGPLRRAVDAVARAADDWRFPEGTRQGGGGTR
ncbi:IclR family transcriptional regulator [Hasllibacter halocynthiae]|uniref:IclR family transcriptional regulator n=1 Tax=Hasllibacter halocynthiae TaxID=595589 RepID=A0A2T0X6N6_9RHOB|nr:IclR family transcriptional regulator [Hasllibacter halocynthiae]PRY94596.1 IclR family transcriptional regulator [Hasllibacter halocynthiae]